jgi:3-hydroxybutyryl-CoA dehydrogenase
MSIRVVGVIGAGIMGTGVAQALAQTGHHVILVDVADEILERAKREIRNGIRFHGLFKKGPKAEGQQDAFKNIRFSLDYDLLRDADFVVENVTEKWDLKRQVYERLDSICREPCVIAANTSAIPITRIASATRRAAKVIGMHFMNPAPVQPTVEVIRGYCTADETVESAKMLLSQMGKDWIIVNDSPGFVSNRVLMLTINEAIFLLQEQVAKAEEIDRIFKTCFGHKMGPLETADLIGLDTILLTIEVLHDSFKDSKYRPCPLLKEMVDAGLYGKKNGRGFYNYSTD